MMAYNDGFEKSVMLLIVVTILWASGAMSQTVEKPGWLAIAVGGSMNEPQMDLTDRADLSAAFFGKGAEPMLPLTNDRSFLMQYTYTCVMSRTGPPVL